MIQRLKSNFVKVRKFHCSEKFQLCQISELCQADKHQIYNVDKYLKWNFARCFSTVAGIPAIPAIFSTYRLLCDLAGLREVTVHTVVCTVATPDLPQDGGAQLVAGHRPKAALGQNVQDGAAGVLPVSAVRTRRSSMKSASFLSV